jgi:hypothetical protein
MQQQQPLAEETGRHPTHPTKARRSQNQRKNSQLFFYTHTTPIPPNLLYHFYSSSLLLLLLLLLSFFLRTTYVCTLLDPYKYKYPEDINPPVLYASPPSANNWEF